jgi:hypothetical protein
VPTEEDEYFANLRISGSYVGNCLQSKRSVIKEGESKSVSLSAPPKYELKRDLIEEIGTIKEFENIFDLDFENLDSPTDSVQFH